MQQFNYSAYRHWTLMVLHFIVCRCHYALLHTYFLIVIGCVLKPQV